MEEPLYRTQEPEKCRYSVPLRINLIFSEINSFVEVF